MPQTLQSVCPVSSLYLARLQSVQLVMSSLTVDPNCPAGQFAHTADVVGDAMNAPGEQHPKRPPLDIKSLFTDKASHWPPHNVRVKPL